MRGLKALVIGMAVLIVIGLGVVAATIATRFSAPDKPPAPPYEATVRIPSGAHVLGSSTGDGKILVRIVLSGGATQILVLDAATGRRIGVVNLPDSGL